MNALILSAAGLELGTLEEAARDVGVDEAWIIRDSARDFRQELEPEPDLVIAVLDPGQSAAASFPNPFEPRALPFANVDVAIRSGLAAGQGVPVLLVVPPPLARPANLAGVVVAPCRLDNYDVLRLHFWAFVSTLPGRTSLAAPQPTARPEAFDASAILAQLYTIDGREPSASSKVERLIASLFSQVGAEFAENPERDQRGDRVDMAVLPSWGSAEILLVEVKAGRLTEGRLKAAESQLQSYVMGRNAALGLLLYHDFDGKHLPSQHTIPLIVRLSVRELIAGLTTNSLPQLISGVVRDSIRRM